MLSEGMEITKKEVAAMEILFYADSRGRQPVREWLLQAEKKEEQAYRKAFQMFSYLEVNGHLIRKGEIVRNDVKRLKGTDDIWQLRINENRILFFYYSADSIVMTHQFKKKKNKTQSKEIIVAENRKRDFLKRL